MGIPGQKQQDRCQGLKQTAADDQTSSTSGIIAPTKLQGCHAYRCPVATAAGVLLGPPDRRRAPHLDHMTGDERLIFFPHRSLPDSFAVRATQALIPQHYARAAMDGERDANAAIDANCVPNYSLNPTPTDFDC